MRKTNTFWIGGLFALMFALPLVSATNANEAILPCVQRDLDLVTLIEASGNANSVPGQILAEAMLAVMEARKPCFTGRVDDSLAQYDRIARRILENRILDAPHDAAQRVGRVGEGQRSAR
jgi:hypothetical protein